MAEAAAATISVECKCGKRLKAPASAVGKKAKCPKCGNVLTVTPPPPPPEDDSLDALYDLAAAGEEAAAQQQLAPRCPSCMREMAPGAVLCTNCGYDTRSGKSVAKSAAPAAAAPMSSGKAAAKGTRFDPAAAAAAAAEASKKKGKVEDFMAPQASFFKGLAGSVGGACIGAFAWFLFAYFTGYELYFLVLGVGALAGLGMQWGQKGYSNLGGFAAAGVTFVIMILARLAVIVALILPMMKEEFNKDQAEQAEEAALRMPDWDELGYDERVVEQLHDDYVKANKVNEENEKQNVAAYQAVEKQLKAMPKPKYDAMVAKFEHEEHMEQLEWLLTEEILKKEHNIHPDAAGQVQTDQANKSAKERIAKMTQPQKDAEYKRLHAAEEKAEAEVLAAAKAAREARKARGEKEPGEVSSGAVFAVGAVLVFFLIFGGIKGPIFMIIALGLAYRTASGSVSSS